MSFSLQLAHDKLEELHKLAPFLSASSRLSTFKKFTFNRKRDATCTSHTLSRAGWISTASRDSRNSAKCPFCLLELIFDHNDDPWLEHTKRSPGCEFVRLDKLVDSLWTLRETVVLAIRCATNEKFEEIQKIIRNFEQFDDSEDVSEKPISREDSEKLLEFRDASMYLTYARRLESFEKFEYDKTKGAKCTSKKLAQAGWYLPKSSSEDSELSNAFAKCPFCLLELEFEATDDPWEEHKKHGPTCDFVRLGKLDEKLWSMDEALHLAARMATMKKFETGLWLVDELEVLKKHDDVSELMNMFMPRTTKRTSIGAL